MNLVYRHFKRVIDVVGAVFGLIIFSPLLLIVAILIRLTMGKPVLFKQIRPGLYERPFTIYKFRTMSNVQTTQGKLLSDEARLTKLGALLRRTSLDELPELWNVLRGDMSLVGPRPLYTKYLPYYSSRERLRHAVRPGITGLAQVSGRNLVDWDKRLELDVQYVKNMSLALDIKILLLTVLKVLKKEGVALQNISDLDLHRKEMRGENLG